MQIKIGQENGITNVSVFDPSTKTQGEIHRLIEGHRITLTLPGVHEWSEIGFGYPQVITPDMPDMPDTPDTPDTQPAS